MLWNSISGKGWPVTFRKEVVEITFHVVFRRLSIPYCNCDTTYLRYLTQEPLCQYLQPVFSNSAWVKLSLALYKLQCN